MGMVILINFWKKSMKQLTFMLGFYQSRGASQIRETRSIKVEGDIRQHTPRNHKNFWENTRSHTAVELYELRL